MSDDNFLIEMIVYWIGLGQDDVVSQMIETIDNDIDLNQKDSNGNVALVLAASRNDFYMVRMLVECGANVNKSDYSGRTAKWWANKHQNDKMKNYLEAEEMNINNHILST